METLKVKSLKSQAQKSLSTYCFFPFVSKNILLSQVLVTSDYVWSPVSMTVWTVPLGYCWYLKLPARSNVELFPTAVSKSGSHGISQFIVNLSSGNGPKWNSIINTRENNNIEGFGHNCSSSWSESQDQKFGAKTDVKEAPQLLREIINIPAPACDRIFLSLTPPTVEVFWVI